MLIESLNNVADWILLSAIPGIAGFIFFYAKSSPWRKYVVGRTQLMLAISLFTVFIVNTASIWLGQDYWGRPLIRILAYGFLSFTVWRLFYILRKIQKLSKELGTADQPTTFTPEDLQSPDEVSLNQKRTERKRRLFKRKTTPKS